MIFAVLDVSLDVNLCINCSFFYILPIINDGYSKPALMLLLAVALCVELDGFNEVQNHCSVHQCMLLPQYYCENRDTVSLIKLLVVPRVLKPPLPHHPAHVGYCSSVTCTCLCTSVHLTGVCSLASNMNAHICMLVVLRQRLVQVHSASSEWPACLHRLSTHAQ